MARFLLELTNFCRNSVEILQHLKQCRRMSHQLTLLLYWLYCPCPAQVAQNAASCKVRWLRWLCCLCRSGNAHALELGNVRRQAPLAAASSCGLSPAGLQELSKQSLHTSEQPQNSGLSIFIISIFIRFEYIDIMSIIEYYDVLSFHKLYMLYLCQENPSYCL